MHGSHCVTLLQVTVLAGDRGVLRMCMDVEGKKVLGQKIKKKMMVTIDWVLTRMCVDAVRDSQL